MITVKEKPKSKVTYDDLSNMFIEHKIDIHKYINKKFGYLPVFLKEFLLKKYGDMASLRNEIIQDVALVMLEQINRLEKEHIYHSLLNYLKYGVLEKFHKPVYKKEMYDFEIGTTKDGRVITFLETVIDDLAFEAQEKKEQQEMYESLLTHIKNAELTDYEYQIIELYIFKNPKELTLEEIATLLGKKKSAVSTTYSIAIRKLRAYYIINHDVSKLLNSAKSVAHGVDWTKEELEFVVANYKILKRKGVLSHLNKNRDKKIDEANLKRAARKLGVMDSSKSDAGTLSIYDFLNKATKKDQFTNHEDFFIYKNWHSVDHAKILEVINFERDNKTTLEELEIRASMSFNTILRKYENKN